jgi:hypothetical protein
LLGDAKAFTWEDPFDAVQTRAGLANEGKQDGRRQCFDVNRKIQARKGAQRLYIRRKDIKVVPLDAIAREPSRRITEDRKRIAVLLREEGDVTAPNVRD